jgi:hypothetical protein
MVSVATEYSSKGDLDTAGELQVGDKSADSDDLKNFSEKLLTPVWAT